MSSLVIFLQAATGGSMQTIQTIGMLALIIVVFYFFMIRPQQKKQKALQEARQAMKVGDKIITAGGVHGKIREIGETYFIIEIAENVKIKIDKASVFVISDEAPKA